MNVGTGGGIAFGLASLILAATPGPGVLYIVTRTLAQGRRAGLASVAAVALGNLTNALLAAIGLAALFAMSSIAFTVVKTAGAAYLCLLGVQALMRAKRGAEDLPPTVKPLPRVFRDGVLVSLLNPKTALFFAAFLPQFIDSRGSTIVQSAALGTVFVLVAAVTDSIYVFAAHAIASTFARHGRIAVIGRYASAATYFGLAALTAFSDPRRLR